MSIVAVLLALITLLETLAPDVAAFAALRALLAAPSFSAALAAISFQDWIVIGEKALDAGPQVIAALQKLGPAFAAFADDLKLSNADAAANIRAFYNSNQPDSIPGYLADGSVGMIPNPNK